MDLDSGEASGTSPGRDTPVSDEVFDLDIDTGEFEADETELKTIMAEVAQSAPSTDRVPVRPRIRKIASDDINMDEAEAYFKNLSSNRPEDEDEEEDDSEGGKPKRRSFHTRVRCPEEKAKLGENIHGYSGMQPALMPDRPRRRSPSPIRPPPAVTPPPPVVAPPLVATEPSPKTALASSTAVIAFPSISIVPGQTNLIMVNGQACYITLTPAGVPGPAAASVTPATVIATTATVTPESASAAFTPEGTSSYLNMLQSAVARGSLAVRKVDGDALRKEWRGRSRSRSPAYRDRAQDEDRNYRPRGKSQKSFGYSEREKDAERRDRYGRNLPRRSLPEDGGDGRYYDRRSPAHDSRRSSPYNDRRSPPRRDDKSVRPVTSAPLPRSSKPTSKEKDLINPATFKLAPRSNGQDLFFNSKPATRSQETLQSQINKRPALINPPLRSPVKPFKKDNKLKNEPRAKTAFVDSVPEHSVQEVNSHNLSARVKGRTSTNVHIEKPDYERSSFRFPRAVNEALCWVRNEEALFQPSETPAWSPRRTLLVTPKEKPVVYENYLKRRSLSPEIPPPPRRAPREGYFNGNPTHAPSAKSGNQAASGTSYQTPAQMGPYEENRTPLLLPCPGLLPTPKPVGFLFPPPVLPAASVNGIMNYEPADHGLMHSGNANGYLSGAEVPMTGVPLPLQAPDIGYSSSMRPAAQLVQTSDMNFSLNVRPSTQLPMPTTSDTGPRFQLEAVPARADGLPPQPSSSGNGTRSPDPFRFENGSRYHDRDEPEFSSFGDRSSVAFPRNHVVPPRQREMPVYEQPTRPSHPAAKKPSIFLRLS